METPSPLLKVRLFPETHFVFFRVCLGLYLFVHFFYLISYAPEIFSNEGMIPDPRLNFTFGLFPNILLLFDSPQGTEIFIAGLAVLSLCYAVGFLRRLAAFLLWYGLACLFNRNNLISNPSLPYVGWLLLATILVPSGQKSSVPPSLVEGAWWLLGVGYWISGYAKLKSPSWIDGSAMHHLLENPLARDYFLRQLFLSMPQLLLKLMTWSVLAIELGFMVLVFWKRARPAAWLLSVMMHLGILTVIDFADLTFGMLVFHLFLFDPSWLGRVARIQKW